MQTRKAKEQYLKFVKGSIKEYRYHLGHLSIQLPDDPGLAEVCQQLNIRSRYLSSRQTSKLTGAGPSAEDTSVPSKETKVSLRRACYETLIRIGDLSRYRSTELAENKWEAASKCYAQATRIFPSIGTAWNSLAVLSKQQDDHLAAIYYVYRSLVVDEPFPDGSGNLEVGFKAVKRKYDNVGLFHELGVVFIALQASCYYDGAFRHHDDLQVMFKSLLSQSDSMRTDPSTTALLERMCLINVAALYYIRKSTNGEGLCLHFGFC